MTDDNFPPLPRPWGCGLCGAPPGYTVEHMRDYARAAVEAALAAAPQAEPVAKVVQTAPASIWLQVSDDLEHEDEPFPRGSLASEVTWSEDSVMDVEVQYVRADLRVQR